jgi:hypothetical protein
MTHRETNATPSVAWINSMGIQVTFTARDKNRSVQGHPSMKGEMRPPGNVSARSHGALHLYAMGDHRRIRK